MNTVDDIIDVKAVDVRFTEHEIGVKLEDGRSITVPISWFPRLVKATPEERADWYFIGGGLGIHWPKLDEDISVEGLLAGNKPGESDSSLEQWNFELNRRRKRVEPEAWGEALPLPDWWEWDNGKEFLLDLKVEQQQMTQRCGRAEEDDDLRQMEFIYPLESEKRWATCLTD